MKLFHDRREAGRKLASHLMTYADRADVLVLALPRGGVPVAFEVAQALQAPLDVWVVRKIGVPGQEELALGAVAMGDWVVLNERLIRALNISRPEIESLVTRERQELNRRSYLYRAEQPLPPINGRT